MDKDEALKTAKEYATLVRSELSPSEIFLFGSYASGTPHEWSDIDIAVVIDHFQGSILDTTTLLWTLRRNINSAIEPVLLDSSCDRSGFLETIRQSGIAI